MNFETVAMINSLKNKDKVTILQKVGDNEYYVRYKGMICTAIYNQFTGLYYVDDIYGVVNNIR